MALPKLTVMKHELSLPSTGEKVTFRPFLVKEEKILMMAMQSGKTIDMVKALRQIIENCVESDIASSDLPTFDIEYIFLQLRARSVGETIPINYSNKDDICEDGKNKCDFFVEINLDDITIEKDKNHKALIDITKDIKVKMKYPKVETTTNIAGVEGEKLVDATFDLIGESIEYIMDGEDIHKPTDYTKVEIDDFLNSLSSEQFKKVQEFFETMPKLRKEVTAKCKKCGKKDHKILEGLNDFFV